MSLTGEKKINRTLFILEYFNHLTWQLNPRNTNVQVNGYRIYEVVNGVKNAQALAVLDANTLSYSHRNVARDQQYSYFVTAVDIYGYESTGELVTVR